MGREAETMERIVARARRYSDARQAKLFAIMVSQPPTHDSRGVIVRRRGATIHTRFWDGYTGKAQRSVPSSDASVAYAAGKYRLELEDAGHLPRIDAVEVDQATGRILETIQPKPTPGSLFGSSAGYVMGEEAPDGAFFVLYDRENGGDWIDADLRWAICRYTAAGDNTGILSIRSRRDAVAILKDAAGDNLNGFDFGEEDGLPQP